MKTLLGVLALVLVVTMVGFATMAIAGDVKVMMASLPRGPLDFDENTKIANLKTNMESTIKEMVQNGWHIVSTPSSGGNIFIFFEKADK